MKVADESEPMVSASSGHESSTSKRRGSFSTPLGAPARNVPRKARLVHDLDGKVLKQMCQLGIAHAILEGTAGVAQAHGLAMAGAR